MHRVHRGEVCRLPRRRKVTRRHSASWAHPGSVGSFVGAALPKPEPHPELIEQEPNPDQKHRWHEEDGSKNKPAHFLESPIEATYAFGYGRVACRDDHEHNKCNKKGPKQFEVFHSSISGRFEQVSREEYERFQKIKQDLLRCSQVTDRFK